MYTYRGQNKRVKVINCDNMIFFYQNTINSEVINTNCNGSRKELALYPADSLHISKTLNPFDIPNTICLNCNNY